MANRSLTRKWVFLPVIMLLVASMITIGVFSARRHRPVPQNRPQVTALPPVFSKVKRVEVVKTWIVNQDLGVPDARIEIHNSSDKDIVAIDLVCGDGAVTRNGLTEEEHPIVVLKAHDNAVLEMNFSEMTFGAPLVVSAVTYADGTEEGDQESLKAMHLGREHDRAKAKADKEKDQRKGAAKP